VRAPDSNEVLLSILAILCHTSLAFLVDYSAIATSIEGTLLLVLFVMGTYLVFLFWDTYRYILSIKVKAAAST
jgi:hypothetical protein